MASISFYKLVLNSQFKLGDLVRRVHFFKTHNLVFSIHIKPKEIYVSPYGFLTDEFKYLNHLADLRETITLKLFLWTEGSCVAKEGCRLTAQGLVIAMGTYSF